MVCTSSLDLGVDFSPVEQVIQIGGPERNCPVTAESRSMWSPARCTSTVICVPTQAMELIEYAAARKSMAKGKIEEREPLDAPLDLLAQHLITLALGGGFKEGETISEMKTTAWSYRNLTKAGMGLDC